MSKEVSAKEQAVVAAPDWTAEQMKLIRDTVAKGATPDELKLFLYRCRNMGLDPLKPNQIYFIKYGNNPGTMVVGVDGFRSIASRTGKHMGSTRGILRDDKGNCIGAWAEVHRSDWKHPAREEVSMREYNTGKSQWARMPETMIKKVAEVAALRMAFPDDLGGLYAKEEMDQAETHQDAEPESPPPIMKARLLGTGDKESVEPAEYIVPVTEKFRGKKLKDIPLDELTGIVNWYVDRMAQGGDFGPPHKEFVEYATRFLQHAMGAQTNAHKPLDANDPHGDGVPF